MGASCRWALFRSWRKSRGSVHSRHSWRTICTLLRFSITCELWNLNLDQRLRFLLPSIKFPAVSDYCRAYTWHSHGREVQLVSVVDESVRSLTTQSPAAQLQSFSEDSVFDDVSIELPDLEETQIIDNEEDQVSVFWPIFSLVYFCILRNETKWINLNWNEYIQCHNSPFPPCDNQTRNKTAEVQNMQIPKYVFCETSSSKPETYIQLISSDSQRFSYMQHDAEMIDI